VLVQLSNVAFRYGRRAPWVLRDVDLTLPPGRILEITGPNGAGKSTLLRIMAGTLRPSQGDVRDRPPVVGFAPERFPAAQPFTVTGYLRHQARIRRAPLAAALDWAARLGLCDLMDTRLSELSKGSAQKVGLVQALFTRPGLLILDEPFAGLDPAIRGALPSILGTLAEEGTTVVVSDHQATLRTMPDISRLRVHGHTVAPPTATDEHAVIELVVPAAEADDAVRKLRADGYAVRGVRR
jgi:ABC-type multidrug transport system ATPase subunit